MNRQTLVIIGLIGVIILLLWFHGCEAKNFKEEITLLKTANDTLIKKRNKDSTETAKIGLLQASNSKLFLKLQTQDETIRSLQEEVKRNRNKIDKGGSVTTVTTSTTYSSTATTSVIVRNKDTIYTASNKDKTWIDWTSTATKDSTSLKLKVKNAYTVVIGSEKNGLFKRKPIVEITNKNPYTETTALRAFEVKDTRKSRFGLGLQAGFGALITGKSINTGGYIGVGFNYILL